MKEQLVSLIQAEGYDMITACELATDCISRFRSSGLKKETYTIGKTTFTIERP